MRKRVSAKRRIVRGNASGYISHANLQHGDKVVLACRVSTYQQDVKGNLRNQTLNLSAEVEKLGAEVVGIVRYAGPGSDPYWLYRAKAIAEQYGAKIVAESTNRLIRHPDYHSKLNYSAQARTIELEDLSYWTRGVELTTVLHPDATPKEERAYQTKRGQRAKNRKGGRRMRPKKRRESLKPEAIRLRKNGNSIRAIARQINVPKSTIQRWVADF